MPCAITSGYTIDCRENVGGIQAIWLISNADLYDASGNTLVVESSGTVTGMTKRSGKRFYKFEVPRGTAVASTNMTGSMENGTVFFTHSMTFPINTRTATVRNIITTLAKNRLTFVTLEMDGVYRMYGQGYGLMMDSTTNSSGTAPGDRNGAELIFSSMEINDFLVVSSTVAAALETPGTV
jgi:hypothetical protein